MLNSATKKSNNTIYTFFSCAFIVVSFIIQVFEEKLPNILGYFDEIVAVFCFLGIFLYLLSNQGRIPYKESLVSACILLIMVVGLIGNLFSNLQPWKIVFVDAFLFMKPYFTLIFFLLTMTTERAKRILPHITRIAKLGLLFLAICGLLGHIVDLGMFRNESFAMFSKFYGTVSIWAILFFVVVFCSKARFCFLYFLLMSFVVFLTQSGLGLTIVGVILLFYIMLEKIRFHWIYMPILGISIFLLGYPVFAEYFLDSTTPRYLLFYYSLITLRNYAPIGSGFATYGSAMAARNYSPLYYEYGFAKKYMMSPLNSDALQDSYFPIIFAQFGFLGTILFIAFLCILLRQFVFNISQKRVLCCALIVLATLLISCIGFQSLNMWGCVIFFFFVTYCKLGQKQISGANIVTTSGDS